MKRDVCQSDTETVLVDHLIQNILNKLETKQKKFQKGASLAVLNNYSSNHAKLLQSYESVSLETQRLRAMDYNVFKILKGLIPNFFEGNIFSFPKSNTKKKQSSFSLQKHSKVWKQESAAKSDSNCVKCLTHFQFKFELSLTVQISL